jgi:large subunit ribosomal protein L29
MAKKQKRAGELRAMSDEDLAKALEEAQQQLFSVRLQLSTRQLSNVSEASKVRRQIARIKTVQQERLLVQVLAAEEGE